MTGDSSPFQSDILSENERLTFALHAAGVGTWELDLPGQTVRWDERCRALYGFAGGEVVPLQMVLVLIHAEDRHLVKEAIDWALNPQSGGHYDIRFRTQGAEDGVIRWLHCKGKAYFDLQRQFSRFSGIAQDVTAQVHQQQRLEASIRLNKLATDGAGVGWFHIYGEDGRLEYDPLLASILTGRENLHFSRQDLVEFIHPDDLPIRYRAYQEAKTTGRVEYEVRFVWDDGSVHWVRLVGHFYKAAKGNQQNFTGIAFDVTQVTCARKALEASEERFRRMIEQAPVATCVLVGENLTIDVANKVMLEVWGRDQSIVGLPFEQAFPEMKHQPHIGFLKQVLQTGQPYVGKEGRTDLFRDGQWRTLYFDFTYKPLRDSSGQVYGVIVMTADVTQSVLTRQQTEQVQEALRQSEVQFRLLAETVPQIVWLTDPEGRVEFFNKQWGYYTGSPQKPNSAGEVTVDFVHPEDGPATMAAFTEARLHGTMFKVEHRIRSKTGQYRWFLVMAQPYRDPGTGNITRWVGSSTDIHDRILSERALRKSEERFRHFVTASSDTIFTMSADWSRVIHLIGNDFLADHQEPFQGWIQEYIPLPEQVRVKEAIDKAIADRNIFELEHQVLKADGSVGWSLSRAIPVLNEQGLILEWFGTASDVTEQIRARKQVEDSEGRYRALSEELESRVLQRTHELQLVNDDLSRSNESLEQFAYIASHDLQEPLRKIQAFSTLLESEYGARLGETGVSLLNRITTAGARMSSLIKALLAYSRVSARQQSFEPVSLDAIVSMVVNTLDLEITTRQAVLEIDPLPWIKGDESQLGQLFQNLLTNALKFTPKGKAPLIKIRCARLDRQDIPGVIRPTSKAVHFYKICVTDHGIGFDPKYIDRIFEVFQRLHTSPDFPGTGIGLAICQRVVRNHGGVITATGQPGEGATFCIYLPAQDNYPKALGADSES